MADLVSVGGVRQVRAAGRRFCGHPKACYDAVERPLPRITPTPDSATLVDLNDHLCVGCAPPVAACVPHPRAWSSMTAAAGPGGSGGRSRRSRRRTRRRLRGLSTGFTALRHTPIVPAEAEDHQQPPAITSALDAGQPRPAAPAQVPDRARPRALTANGDTVAALHTARDHSTARERPGPDRADRRVGPPLLTRGCNRTITSKEIGA